MNFDGLEIDVEDHPLIAACDHHSLQHLLYFFLKPHDLFLLDGEG